MKKTLIVMKNEIITLLARPSFWIAALGIPLVAGLIYAVVGFINRDSDSAESISQAFLGSQEVLPEGYVDLSGILVEVPVSIPPGTFLPFNDETSAALALQAGEIAAYYIIAPDYLKSGLITYVRPDFNPLSSESDRSGMLNWILDVNLVGGDMFFANLVGGPLEVEEIPLAPTNLQFDAESPFAWFVPYAVSLIFYMLIISSTSLLMNNISKEKENRVMEVILTSVTPRQLLAGKILGLGIVGLGQTILWLSLTYFLINKSSSVFQILATIHIPFSFVLWGLVFFLLGYAIYASLMAGLGALAPNLREASQSVFVILLPLIIPLFFASTVFAEDPHGAIATVLSIFPLTAPAAMMSRLSSGGVPGWQPWLASALMLGTAVLVVRAVAGMFRAQSLLAGQGFNVKVYLKALIGKV